MIRKSMNTTRRQQKILILFLQNVSLQSSEVFNFLVKEEKVSSVTVKRELSELVSEGFIGLSGTGRSTAYHITIQGRLFSDVNPAIYCQVEPDKRFGQKRYSDNLFSQTPIGLFTENESKLLEDGTQIYRRRSRDLSLTIQKKELERLIIELSWKSSRIEGNTYTLLDTEKLILENKEATGHDKKEAQMILNHKEAFTFVRENSSIYKTLTRTNTEELHKILVKNMNVNFGLRSRAVGVTGSIYQPLDNIHQIQEGFEDLSVLISKMTNPYAKSLMALLGISYLQPFEDGNKRTARLMANALLLAHDLAPLSYRSVDENEYREAMLVFYELNSLIPFKKIFITQYDFAARNYIVR